MLGNRSAIAAAAALAAAVIGTAAFANPSTERAVKWPPWL